MNFDDFDADSEVPGHVLWQQGRKLTKKQSVEITRLIKHGKATVRDRALLIGYYSKHLFRPRKNFLDRSRQILWLIANQPTHSILGRSYCQLNYGELSDHASLKRAADLWTRQIHDYQNNAQVLSNAACFFREIHDNERSEKLLLRAKQIDPENPNWPGRLSQFFELQKIFADPIERLELARKVLAESELECKLTKSHEGKALKYFNLAWKAYEAADYEKAESIALKIIDCAREYPKECRSTFSCKQLHDAYSVLGSIALDKRDTTLAIEHLLSSVTVPVTSPGNNVVPDMSLAMKLLALGENKAVVLFIEKSLEICPDQLDEHEKRRAWLAALQTGQEPVFERFKDYLHY